jgi:hypothetical protein
MRVYKHFCGADAAPEKFSRYKKNLEEAELMMLSFIR